MTDLSLALAGTFSNLEAERCDLERRVGTEALLKVYKLMKDFDRSRNVDDRLVYSDVRDILGEDDDDAHRDLIGGIFQLVLADKMFNNHQEEGAVVH